MRNIVFILLSVSLLALNCGRNKANPEAVSPESVTQINPENIILIDLDVQGMTCTGCENTIKTGVSGLDGVVSVEASHTEAKTYVKADTSLTSLVEIEDMITAKGYQVINASIKEN